jgi:hypothetical protein
MPVGTFSQQLTATPHSASRCRERLCRARCPLCWLNCLVMDGPSLSSTARRKLLGHRQLLPRWGSMDRMGKILGPLHQTLHRRGDLAARGSIRYHLHQKLPRRGVLAARGSIRYHLHQKLPRRSAAVGPSHQMLPQTGSVAGPARTGRLWKCHRHHRYRSQR